MERTPLTSPQSTPEIATDDFVRRFAMRTSNLMWFLGAGASASSGIPTAGDMIWEFKQRLFVTQRKTSPRAVADLSDPNVRLKLQNFIDSMADAPAPGSADEYAALFEIVYPAESDRRAYIDSKVKGGKPSYGHIALATLMHGGISRLVWTTNFDPLVADACAKVYDGTGHLTTISLGEPDLAAQAISEDRWPIEVKIHGDFRSRRLKNTSDQLRLQDERLRRILVDCCRRSGLIAVGYSGRDASVMDTLESALDTPGAFPAGLFWLHRGDGEPYESVSRLISKARAAGVEASLIRMENFDETMRDLVRVHPSLVTRVLDQFSLERRRRSPAPRRPLQGNWPILRLNAIPILQSPTLCRVVACEVGGYAEARGAAEAAGVSVLVARTKAGVLAFGTDDDVHAAFDGYNVTSFDLHTIETKRLRYQSGERGLLQDALACALSRHRGLEVIRRGSSDLLYPSAPSDQRWRGLKQLVGALSGTVPGVGELRWFEGLEVRLDWADDRLWLLLEPRTVFDGATADNKAVAADFARERTIKRYNRDLNHVIDFWARALSGTGDTIRAFGIADGVDATFRLGTDTAYSRKSS
jgi:NAD-dependent SIR2 family protein deacetylase